MIYHGDMRCRVCGWWPPVTRADKHEQTTRPAHDHWRWKKLREHIEVIALDEDQDGNGPHNQLLDAIPD